MYRGTERDSGNLSKFGSPKVKCREKLHHPNLMYTPDFGYNFGVHCGKKIWKKVGYVTAIILSLQCMIQGDLGCLFNVKSSLMDWNKEDFGLDCSLRSIP